MVLLVSSFTNAPSSTAAQADLGRAEHYMHYWIMCISLIISNFCPGLDRNCVVKVSK